jgi:hypothetical protein
MSVEFHAWIQKRIALAKRLNEGECGGYYGDAMLIALEKSGDSDLVEKVRATRPEAFPPWKIDTLRVTGKQVDQTEAELISLDPRLATKKLRHFSYGNVFYRHVRSGYTHEYHSTDSASSVSTAREPEPVSYMKSNRPPVRRIYFDVTWVAEVVESVSTSVIALRTCANRLTTFAFAVSPNG